MEESSVRRVPETNFAVEVFDVIGNNGLYQKIISAISLILCF